MNFELFIAKRIATTKYSKGNISSSIIKIAILAIALGIAIMMISVSISIGFQKKIRAKVSGFKGHIQIVNYDNNNSDISTNSISVNDSLFSKVREIKGVTKAQVFANKAGIIRTAESFEGVIFKGVDKNYDFSFFDEYIKEGRTPNFDLKRNKEIIISEFIAKSLQLQVGDTLQMWFKVASSNLGFKRRKPIVVGIYNSGFEKFDKTTVVGDIREVQKINKWNSSQVGGVEVFIDNFDDLEEKGKAVYFAVGSLFNAKTIVDSYPTIFEWVKLFDNNVIFILIIMILIAGINMIIALLVLILEKVQMIGVLKALGSTNTSIRKIFLYNAAYLVTKGLIYGNLIGLFLIYIQKYGEVLTLDPKTYHVDTVPVYTSFSYILALNIGTLILCFLILLIPSFIITKIQPSKSIKFV